MMKFYDEKIVQFGIGTARVLADSPRSVRGINHAIDRGVKVFETAERFGNWTAEEKIGDLFASKRNDLFLIGKVHPSRSAQCISSCEESLRKLRIDKFDLYLLHFDSSQVDYQRLTDDLRELERRGLIDSYGVGSIDLDKLLSINLSLGAHYSANQVQYSPARRNAENGLIGKHREAGIALMSYSILETTLREPRFMEYCSDNGINPGALALRWVQRQGSVFPLVSAYSVDHIDHLLDDRINLDLHLLAIDEMFPNLGQTELQVD
jgi:diketogulonate reductase-like aldo/keto reductase